MLELPEPQQRWIPFSDYSPFYNGTYTVWRSGENKRKADWSNKGWSDLDTGERLGLFTHWCPMPER